MLLFVSIPQDSMQELMFQILHKLPIRDLLEGNDGCSTLFASFLVFNFLGDNEEVWIEDGFLEMTDHREKYIHKVGKMMPIFPARDEMWKVVVVEEGNPLESAYGVRKNRAVIREWTNVLNSERMSEKRKIMLLPPPPLRSPTPFSTSGFHHL